jgi:hypothetical protein
MDHFLGANGPKNGGFVRQPRVVASASAAIRRRPRWTICERLLTQPQVGRAASPLGVCRPPSRFSGGGHPATGSREPRYRAVTADDVTGFEVRPEEAVTAAGPGRGPHGFDAAAESPLPPCASLRPAHRLSRCPPITQTGDQAKRASGTRGSRRAKLLPGESYVEAPPIAGAESSP